MERASAPPMRELADQAFSRAAGAPLVEGNSVRLLIDAKENYPAWLEAIGAAPGSYPTITPDSVLGAAVHGADIEVDEWGTVAAAATGFGFDSSGPPEPDFVVAADRPFFYFVRHRDSGLVLFAGQVTDP